jgi:hypothetical protein
MNIKTRRPFGRNYAGSIIAEYMPVIMVLFFALFFPFLNLATSLLRYSILVAAAHDAANAAGHAYFFLDNSQAGLGKPASLTLANETAQRFVQALNGATPNAIRINTVRTRIIRSLKTAPYTTNTFNFGEKLTAAANTDQFIYCLEVSINANINPLMRMDGPFFRIPGLTAPIVTTVNAREFAENPQGLNQ